MKSIYDYFKSTLLFINSITFKLEDTRKHLNYQIYLKNSMAVPNKSEDKYYLNLAGLRTKFDPPVMIKLPSGQDLELTRESINKNPNIKYELLKYDTYFNTLCNNNPSMSLYIRGCLHDLTLTEIIEAENYSILSYDKSFLTENEMNIIPSLQTFIVKYFKRYHNKKYMLDELYLPATLSNFYLSLFQYVLVLKMQNILTYKADDMHIQSFLISHKRILSDISIFDKQTQIFLYGNIKRLFKNTGKNKILDEVLNKVLDSNEFYTAKLVFRLERPELIKSNIKNYLKVFYDNKYKLTAEKASNNVYNILGKKYVLNKIYDLQNENNQIAKQNIRDNAVEQKEIKSLILNVSDTKTFILDQPEKIKTFENNNYVMTISNILYIINNTNTNFYIDYYNNSDHKIYKLGAKDVNALLVKFVALVNKITTNKITLQLGGIFNKSLLDKKAILNKTWYKEKNSKLYDFFLDDPNLNKPVISGEYFKEYIKAVRGIERKIWYAISNASDLTLKNDIRLMGSNILQKIAIAYDLNKIDKHIRDNDLDNFFVDIDYIKSIYDILEKLTGLVLYGLKEVKDRFNKVIDFFNKTTSYTVQLLMDLDFKETFINTSSRNDLSLGYKAFLEVKDADWYRYEYDDRTVRSLVVDNTNEHINDNELVIPTSRRAGDTFITTLIEKITRPNLFGSKSIRPRLFKTKSYGGETLNYEDLVIIRNDEVMIISDKHAPSKIETVDTGDISPIGNIITYRKQLLTKYKTRAFKPINTNDKTEFITTHEDTFVDIDIYGTNDLHTNTDMGILDKFLTYKVTHSLPNYQSESPKYSQEVFVDSELTPILHTEDSNVYIKKYHEHKLETIETSGISNGIYLDSYIFTHKLLKLQPYRTRYSKTTDVDNYLSKISNYNTEFLNVNTYGTKPGVVHSDAGILDRFLTYKISHSLPNYTSESPKYSQHVSVDSDLTPILHAEDNNIYIKKYHEHKLETIETSGISNGVYLDSYLFTHKLLKLVPYRTRYSKTTNIDNYLSKISNYETEFVDVNTYGVKQNNIYSDRGILDKFLTYKVQHNLPIYVSKSPKYLQHTVVDNKLTPILHSEDNNIYIRKYREHKLETIETSGISNGVYLDSYLFTHKLLKLEPYKTRYAKTIDANNHLSKVSSYNTDIVNVDTYGTKQDVTHTDISILNKFLTYKIRNYNPLYGASINHSNDYVTGDDNIDTLKTNNINSSKVHDYRTYTLEDTKLGNTTVTSTPKKTHLDKYTTDKPKLDTTRNADNLNTHDDKTKLNTKPIKSHVIHINPDDINNSSPNASNKGYNRPYGGNHNTKSVITKDKDDVDLKSTPTATRQHRVDNNAVDSRANDIAVDLVYAVKKK